MACHYAVIPPPYLNLIQSILETGCQNCDIALLRQRLLLQDKRRVYVVVEGWMISEQYNSDQCIGYLVFYNRNQTVKTRRSEKF